MYMYFRGSYPTRGSKVFAERERERGEKKERSSEVDPVALPRLAFIAHVLALLRARVFKDQHTTVRYLRLWDAKHVVGGVRIPIRTLFNAKRERFVSEARAHANASAKEGASRFRIPESLNSETNRAGWHVLRTSRTGSKASACFHCAAG